MGDSQTTPTGKLPPHDISAEEAVLGSLVLDGAEYVNVGKLMADDFYVEPHGIIFGAIQTLYHRYEAINQITIAQELDRIGKLEYCGGVAYLSHLISIVPTPLDCNSYADIVIRLSICRKAIILGQKIAAVGFAANEKAQITVDQISDLVNTFRRTSGDFGELITPKNAADMMFELMQSHHQKKEGISWGFRDLDRMTIGIHPSEYVIVGARPSVGKTQLVLDIADVIDSQNKKVLFVSLEMSMEQLQERQISKITNKSIRTLRKGTISQKDEEAILSEIGAIAQGNTYWITRTLTSQQILTKATWLQANVGLDVVIVDYLQKLKDCNTTDRDTQNVRVGRASGNLKEMALDLGISVIVPCQFNREYEKKKNTDDDRPPQLSDLRDSGSIEQDADVVFLLDRDPDGTEHDGGKHDKSMLRLKMAKNRQLGTAPAIKLRWDNKKHRYTDYPPDSEFAKNGQLFPEDEPDDEDNE
jgi:replicative DNA helicase